MPAIAMTPKAGAHGELCGMMAIKAALEARGEQALGRAGAGFGARHQSGDGGAARLSRRVGAGARRRHGRSRGGEEAALARRRRHHADQPQHLRPVRARRGGDRRGRARGRRLLLLPTAPTSTPSSARCGPATSASTPCTSTCTRPSRPRTAAAARAPGRWCCRRRSRRSCRCPTSVADADGVRYVEHARADARGGAQAASAACAPSTARWACSCARWPTCSSHGVGRHAAGDRGRGAQRQLRARLASPT